MPKKQWHQSKVYEYQMEKCKQQTSQKKSLYIGTTTQRNLAHNEPTARRVTSRRIQKFTLIMEINHKHNEVAARRKHNKRQQSTSAMSKDIRANRKKIKTKQKQWAQKLKHTHRRTGSEKAAERGRSHCNKSEINVK